MLLYRLALRPLFAVLLERISNSIMNRMSRSTQIRADRRLGHEWIILFKCSLQSKRCLFWHYVTSITRILTNATRIISRLNFSLCLAPRGCFWTLADPGGPLRSWSHQKPREIHSTRNGELIVHGFHRPYVYGFHSHPRSTHIFLLALERIILKTLSDEICKNIMVGPLPPKSLRPCFSEIMLLAITPRWMKRNSQKGTIMIAMSSRIEWYAVCFPWSGPLDRNSIPSFALPSIGRDLESRNRWWLNWCSVIICLWFRC